MKKKLLASAIASALVVGVGAEAADVKVSGQVNRAIVIPSDNTTDDTGGQVQFLDNDMSGSRFRIKASHDIGSGMKAGIRLEMQTQSNKAGKLNGRNYTDSTGGNLGNEDNIDLRYQDLYFSGGFGKVSLGKGDGAANGSTEVDLSGTEIIAGSNMTDLYGGFDIGDGAASIDSNNDGVNETEGVTNIGSLYDIVDANSRINRLRYDSLNFSGFSFALSYGQQEATELGLKYAGKASGVQYEVRAYGSSLGESEKDLDDGNTKAGLSGSVVLPSGFNFTLSASQQEADIPASGTDSVKDRENMWAKVGYKIGKHAFAIDYGQTTDTPISYTDASGSLQSTKGTDVETETNGISYVFTPVKSVELYAGIREYAFDKDQKSNAITNEVDDPTFVTIGSRVKF